MGCSGRRKQSGVESLPTEPIQVAQPRGLQACCPWGDMRRPYQSAAHCPRKWNRERKFLLQSDYKWIHAWLNASQGGREGFTLGWNFLG